MNELASNEEIAFTIVQQSRTSQAAVSVQSRRRGHITIRSYESTPTRGALRELYRELFGLENHPHVVIWRVMREGKFEVRWKMNLTGLPDDAETDKISVLRIPDKDSYKVSVECEGAFIRTLSEARQFALAATIAHKEAERLVKKTTIQNSDIVR